MPELWELPLVALADALCARRLSAADVTTAFLERARRVDASVNCFITLDDDALEVARRRDEQAAAGGPLPSLHGVPFAYKDVLVADGRIPTGAARNVRLQLRATSSTVLERLDENGAVSLGTLNLDQFAYAATGLNPEFGDTRNPWEPTRIAGGSSSGAAAAVATGAVPFAIGSDTGGSIRIPAAFCGVTGLKPTYGLIPKRGALPLSYSQDTIGILARSALDIAVVLESLAVHDPLDASSLPLAPEHFRGIASRTAPEGAQPLAGLRIGIDRRGLAEQTTVEIAEAAERAVILLAGLGATVVEVDLSMLARYDVAATVLTWAEISAVHGPAFSRAPASYAPPMRARLELAIASNGADHVDAVRYQGQALRAFLDGPLAAADLIVAPTIGGPPPAVASIHDGDADATAVTLQLLRLNRPFSYIGVPALSVPIGFDGSGLPMAMQLVGRPCSEPTLLRGAAAYQATTDWHQRLPPLPADDMQPPLPAIAGEGV